MNCRHASLLTVRMGLRSPSVLSRTAIPFVRVATSTQPPLLHRLLVIHVIGIAFPFRSQVGPGHPTCWDVVVIRLVSWPYTSPSWRIGSQRASSRRDTRIEQIAARCVAST